LMQEPVPLASVYTAIKFLDERDISQFASPDELEHLYRAQGKRRFQAITKRYDGIAIAKEKQYLMILGGPGIGKSTFLKKLGLEALKSTEFIRTYSDPKTNDLISISRSLIPVFLELKTIRDKTVDLTTLIQNEFEVCGFPDTAAFTKLSLSEGRLLILLDGLDEVPAENVDKVIGHIESFVTQYDKNTFIASCRTAAYHSSFRKFTDVTIADFDDAQIEQFIQRWFSSKLDQEADTANQYWQLLQRPENITAKELSQTPLLLTFLCLIYEREQTLPHRRSTLYGRALNIILSEWSAQKRLEQAPIYKDFHPELEKELLSEVAYNSFEEDRLFFSKEDIIKRITVYLSDTLGAPKYLNGPAVLKAIEVQQGILVERATDTYSFSHLTLQEYLTALFILNNHLIARLASEHLTNPRWREVFLLVVGLMGRRGYELLENIDKQARERLQEQPKVCSLVRWANKIIQSCQTDHDNFTKVAIALSLVVEVINATVEASGVENLTITRLTSINTTPIKRAKNNSIKIVQTSDREINIHSLIKISSLYAQAITIACAAAKSDYNGIIRDLVIEIDRAGHFSRVSNISNKIDAIRDCVSYLNELNFFNLSSLLELPQQLLILRNTIPPLSGSANQWNSYAKEIELSFFNALGLEIDDISFSNEEWQCLSDYLYSYELILSCQQSSIGISRKAWESLKERLLTVD
ncbi:MAG: NACHT domain-containing protein, partial [Leptolyngbya sp. SIO3F4]|nr:NACHT domain-containing protein [Leptolyngbya sp. SIO3F4]